MRNVEPQPGSPGGAENYHWYPADLICNSKKKIGIRASDFSSWFILYDSLGLPGVFPLKFRVFSGFSKWKRSWKSFIKDFTYAMFIQLHVCNGSTCPHYLATWKVNDYHIVHFLSDTSRSKMNRICHTIWQSFSYLKQRPLRWFGNVFFPSD